jgi:hypothetical protein
VARTQTPSPELVERVARFKAALIALCREYGLKLKYYHVEYDQYDSDEGFEIVPLGPEESLYEIESALIGKR